MVDQDNTTNFIMEEKSIDTYTWVNNISLQSLSEHASHFKLLMPLINMHLQDITKLSFLQVHIYKPHY